MNNIGAFVLALFFGGVVMPTLMLMVVADIDGAGKAHAAKVQQAEKQGARLINGKISVALWKSGEL